MDGENSASNGRIYVKFGHRDNEEIPLEWAEKMLMQLKQERPADFGKLLTAAIGADRKHA